MTGSYFEIKCDTETRSAEHPALPRFPELVRVRSVTLKACAPPAEPYVRVLADFNVSLTDELVLYELPTDPPLRNDHFEGLGSLKSLKLHGTDKSVPVLPPALVAPLPLLADLNLHLVQMRSALDSLHAPLTTLQLFKTGTKTVAPVSLGLVNLLVTEEAVVSVNVTGAPALSSLKVSSRNSSVVGLTRYSRVRDLGIDCWSETQPEPWQECGMLEKLSLIKSVSSKQQTALPEGWVARCPVLSVLTIFEVPLAPLPERLLQNATALKTLKLKECELKELPKYLFNDSVQLISLDLTYNYLETLPK